MFSPKAIMMPNLNPKLTLMPALNLAWTQNLTALLNVMLTPKLDSISGTKANVYLTYHDLTF
jgi:hypothetical protein